MPAPVAFLKYKHDSNIPKRQAELTTQVLSPLAFFSLIIFYIPATTVYSYANLSIVTLWSHLASISRHVLSGSAMWFQLICLCQNNHRLSFQVHDHIIIALTLIGRTVSWTCWRKYEEFILPFSCDDDAECHHFFTLSCSSSAVDISWTQSYLSRARLYKKFKMINVWTPWLSDGGVTCRLIAWLILCKHPQFE